MFEQNATPDMLVHVEGQEELHVCPNPTPIPARPSMSVRWTLQPSFVTFCKDVLDSTIWKEDADTRVVWITMMELSDSTGLVRATVPGLARLANVSPEVTEAALARLAVLPDADCRVVRVQGGWRFAQGGC